MRLYLKAFCFLIVLLCCVSKTGQCLFKFAPKKDTLGNFSKAQTLQSLKTKIDTIIFQGNEVTRSEVLRREILFQKNDTLTFTAIRRSQSELFNLLLFNLVKITAKRFHPNDSIAPVKGLTKFLKLGQNQANLRRKSYTLVLVTVYERWYIVPVPIFDLRGTSVTQWVKNPTIANLNVGLSLQHQNFTGHGDLFSASFGVGFDPFVGVSYSTPYIFGSDKFGLGVAAEYRQLRNTAEGYNKFEVPIYDQFKRSVAISASHRLSTFNYYGIYAEYASINVHQDVREKYSFSTISKTGIDRFVTLSAYYNYQRMDYILFPMEGTLFSLKLSQVGFPGSQNRINYLRGAVDFRYYQPITNFLSIAWRNFTVLSTNEPVPNHQRLFIGYNTQIRGYTSTIFNGDNLQLNTLELRAPIIRLNTLKLDFIPIEQFSIVQYGLFLSVFVDAGAAWYNKATEGSKNKKTHFDLDDYKYGYGAGLLIIGGYQWTSRLDFAFSDRGDFEIIFEKSVSF